jgi:subtilisin family serine protease
MLPTIKTRGIHGNVPSLAGRAARITPAAAGALAVIWVLSGLPGAAQAGVIQARVERRIMADSLAAEGAAGPAKALLRGNEPVVGSDHRIMVCVTLETRSSDAGGPIVPLVNDAPPAWLRSIPGCEVEGSLGPRVEVRIDPAQVRALAAHAGVMHVGVPPHPVPLVESQGLAGMRVPQFWARYGRGDGVRVGILDVGFANYQQRLGSELPATVKVRAFYDAGSGPDITGGGESHGTACAEILHDVAPGAELYLANAGTEAELRQAVTWLIEQGVEVISHSIAWPLGGGDGTGPIHDVVRFARENGVIWVNAAGNFARGFWGGRWIDRDSDRTLDVDTLGTEAIRLPQSGVGSDVHVWLTWDGAYSTDLDFAIELVSANGQTVLASSQDGLSEPYSFRALDLEGGGDLSGTTIRVRCLRGDPQGRFLRVTRTNGDLARESRVPAGSLAMPADSPDVIAVGAFAWSDSVLESFSSYGPTVDGRAKPEILGPDRVQNSVTSPFTGTSAACPHVAGTVALLLGAGPQGGLFGVRLSATQVTAALKLEAEPLPPASPATPAGATGWGRVRLPVQPLPKESPELRALGNGSKALVLQLERAPGAIRLCEVFDLQGRLVCQLDGAPGENGAVNFSTAPLATIGLMRGRYWAREPATGARVSFLWRGPAAR